jgi:hypothetical protein
MYKDIHKTIYQCLWSKNTWDNHNIYSLIYINITLKLTNIRCEFFKMSKMNHLISLLPYWCLKGPLCFFVFFALLSKGWGTSISPPSMFFLFFIAFDCKVQGAWIIFNFIFLMLFYLQEYGKLEALYYFLFLFLPKRSKLLIYYFH